MGTLAGTDWKPMKYLSFTCREPRSCIECIENRPRCRRCRQAPLVAMSAYGAPSTCIPRCSAASPTSEVCRQSFKPPGLSPLTYKKAISASEPKIGLGMPALQSTMGGRQSWSSSAEECYDMRCHHTQTTTCEIGFDRKGLVYTKKLGLKTAPCRVCSR